MGARVIHGSASVITTPIGMGKHNPRGADKPATGDGEILLKLVRSAFLYRKLRGEGVAPQWPD
jgi:hypothetical protein